MMPETSERYIHSTEIRNKEQREIREEITKTGDEIAQSVREIRERLSPEHLKSQALEKIIIAAAAGLGRSGWFLRRHPVPTLLAGIVLGHLLLRKRRSGTRRRASV